jgi:hypothetical protein
VHEIKHDGFRLGRVLINAHITGGEARLCGVYASDSGFYAFAYGNNDGLIGN